MKSLGSLAILSFTVVKPNYHNMAPKIELKHNCAQLGSVLRSLSKMTRMFSTQLGMKWFKRHLKDNSWVYLLTKTHSFFDGLNSTSVVAKRPLFWVCSRPWCSCFHPFSLTNHSLKSFNKALFLLITLKSHIMQNHYMIIFTCFTIILSTKTLRMLP